MAFDNPISVLIKFEIMYLNAVWGWMVKLDLKNYLLSMCLSDQNLRVKIRI